LTLPQDEHRDPAEDESGDVRHEGDAAAAVRGRGRARRKAYSASSESS